MGGRFTVLGGQARGGIGRLNRDGSVDSKFDPFLDGHVAALALQPDGGILAGGGGFTTVAGQTALGLARLKSDGTLDETFHPGDVGGVASLVVQPDGKILVGGEFYKLGGMPRRGLGRLNPDGTLDPGFDPLVGGRFPRVEALALQPDGKILVGGVFDTVGSLPRAHVARLWPDGAVDAGFHPTSEDGVYAFAVQADGGILVGGFFQALAREPCEYLGRLNADGTRDAGFRPSPDDGINTLASLPDGRLLVGGGFRSVGGLPRHGLARLPNTAPATRALSYHAGTLRWLLGGSSPNPAWVVFEFSLDGAVWTPVGTGERTSGGWQALGVTVPPGGTLRARGLVSDGGSSCWFLTDYLGAPVFVSEPEPQTRNYGETVRFRVRARGGEPLIYQWLRDGAELLDVGQVLGASTAILEVRDLRKSNEGDYQVVVTSPTGRRTSRMARLAVRDPFVTSPVVSHAKAPGQSVLLTVTADGTPPMSYQWWHGDLPVPGATNRTLALVGLRGSEAGIYSVSIRNDAGSITNPAALLAVNLAAADAGFTPAVSGVPVAFSLQPDGKVLLAGPFTNVDGQPRRGLARLHPNGRLDDTFAAQPDDSRVHGASISRLAIQPDGRILAGGTFRKFGGAGSDFLARLHPDGALDGGFDPWVPLPPSVGGGLNDVRVLTDTTLLVTCREAYPTNMVWLDADGTRTAGFGVVVGAFAPYSDGGILAVTVRGTLARFSPEGTLEAEVPASRMIRNVGAISVLADGGILVAAEILDAHGVPEDYLGRLAQDGTLDGGFRPRVDGPVHAFVPQADGKILIGGSFTNVQGATRRGLARLHADGTLDWHFDPGIGGYSEAFVRDLALQADGSVVVLGSFTTLAGESREHLGRLVPTEPATQHLARDGATLSWWRGGTSPEVWRTTFEQSLDGVQWTLLGAGERVLVPPAGGSGAWQLTGLSVPPNARIRARGFTANSFVETILDPGAVPARFDANSIQLGPGGGRFGCRVTGVPGTTVVIECSASVEAGSWAPCSTNTLAAGGSSFVDPAPPTGAARFYRLRLRP